MKPIKSKEQLQKLIDSLDSMTQDQIDACAYCMGASGCGWTKENLKTELESNLNRNQKPFSEVMG